ncbi:Cof-type HAD-IIB family hydrolase [Streptococcus cuniculipharyngis]|uniref:HAD family phosphatase n=1 Tax=Streptococcus cuniculipharyngis TaxID=1562651 RepID=A0A5C5SB94_9STRE|nr:Cof-type HAD-IIB family hydrolase [Streptococcus cuniculipharyngis]TWS96694.1 HAD family phosphatase [Streptococcus cuniculipharyngis]
MTKKIIAIDLDGTLLHSDETISDYTVKTLRKVEALGHMVVIATGRPYRMAWDYYRQLGLKTPMINFNGALTHLPEQKWEQELDVRLDQDYIWQLLDMQQDIQMDFLAAEYRRQLYISFNRREAIEPKLFGLSEIKDEMELLPHKITDGPNALLMKTQAQDKYALADDIKDRFNNQIEVDSWGGPLNILEFAPKGVNKAFALNHLLQACDLDKSQLIAFGDEHNDTEMLAFAQTGYAMKNANPILLDFADEQLQWTNNQDGVARQLETMFLS